MSSYYETVNGSVFDKINNFKKLSPDRNYYSMSFGDPSLPLTPLVVRALSDAVKRLGDMETYTSYEDITGNYELKQAICSNCYQKRADVTFDPAEIFITEGANCVCAAIHEIFDRNSIAAFQNPLYPTFVEANRLAGRKIIYLDCDETNHFAPNLPTPKVDIIYLCSPNNPTGMGMSKAHLKTFVDYANEHQSIIIFDSVYSFFVATPDVPKSIYEIEGAEKCAIEIGSFSKMANLAGLRVGWCVIPNELTAKDTVPGELNQMWKLRQSIRSWGISNIVQHGAIAALSEKGQMECRNSCNYYLENAAMLKAAFKSIGLTCHGGTDAPYLWVKTLNGMNCWEFFDYFMHKTGIAGMPGSLFGPKGENYVRFSTMGKREEIEDAIKNCGSSWICGKLGL